MRLVDPFPPIISFTLHSVGFLGIILDEATQKQRGIWYRTVLWVVPGAQPTGQVTEDKGLGMRSMIAHRN